MRARWRLAVAALAWDRLRAPIAATTSRVTLVSNLPPQVLLQPAQLEHVVMVRALVRCLIQPLGRCVIPRVFPSFAESFHAPARCFEVVVELLRLQLVTGVGGLSDALSRRRGQINPPYVVGFIKRHSSYSCSLSLATLADSRSSLDALS